MTSSARISGIVLIALATGCAGVRDAPLGAAAQTGPLMVDPSLIGSNQGGTVAAEPPRSEAKEEAVVALAPPPAGPLEPVMTGMEAIGIESVAGAPPPSKSQGATEAARALVEVAPAKVAASPPAAAVVNEQPRKIEDPSPVARKVGQPLDVAALTARLRDTNAIGVFTKLTLKNQMDDLLKQFRAHHQSGQKASVAPLRKPYDTLVLKVVSVVQGSDPSLARTIAGSREAIWTILADPEKFNAAS